jgi:hypothetical protein
MSWKDYEKESKNYEIDDKRRENKREKKRKITEIKEMRKRIRITRWVTREGRIRRKEKKRSLN